MGRPCDDLRSIARAYGLPGFRGVQMAEWIYRRGAADISEMTNLPAAARALLADAFVVGRPTEIARQTAEDLTTKFLLEMADGARVESVLLPYEDRSSVCVSSQVGCAAGCAFCATAMMGFTRNLTAGEIIAQVVAASDALRTAPWTAALSEAARRVSHIVFMGMGEPMWNLPAVLSAAALMHDEMGISFRNITISTVGIPEGIRALADADLPVTLAVSLHAGTDETRRALVPVSRKYPMDDVLDAAWYYFDRTGRRVTFEYVLLGGVNDSEEEARALARRLAPGPAHVNLIPWNPAPSRFAYNPPPDRSVRTFRRILEKAGASVTQRMERGQGIAAACGQLVSRHAMAAPRAR